MFSRKDLQSAHRVATARRAFSLAELVVSIGVLVLMLSIAGEVLNLTVSASGQAKAITEINQQLRIFERTLREDLGGVVQGESVLLIKGNPINAYWTQAGKDADFNDDPSDGYPHGVEPEYADYWQPELMTRPRADILMFFTQREATSNVHPQVTTTLQQVVYAHADLGEYVRDLAADPPAWIFELPPPDADALPDLPNTISPVPAERWLLARRTVLLSPHRPAQPLVPAPDTPLDLDDDVLLRGETDVLENFVYENRVLEPGERAPRYLPLIFQESVPYERSQLDPTPPPAVSHGVNQFFLSNCASFKVEWAIDPNAEFVHGNLDLASELYWIDPGALGDPTNPANLPDPIRTLREASTAVNGVVGHDANLTALLTVVLGHGSEAYSMQNRFGDQMSGWISEAPELPRPPGDDRPNITVFTANRRKPIVPGDTVGTVVPDDVFPGALRITLDLFDPRGRLDRPIRHVIVVPLGT